MEDEARNLFGLEPKQEQKKYEHKDFGNRRVYPTKSTMDGYKWIGNNYSIHDVWGESGKETEKGSNIFKLPDGRYYYGNPRFANASYDTEENLKAHLANKSKPNRIGLRILDGEDRNKMEELAQKMRESGMDKVEVADMLFDAGQDWEYTGLKNDDYQLLNPRDWENYMNGDVSADELVYLINKKRG